MPFVTRAVSLVCLAAVCACYLASYPWQGALYDINSVSNYRIPLPASGACDVKSNANMSLQLAYVSGACALSMTLFMVVYNIAPRGTSITLASLDALARLDPDLRLATGLVRLHHDQGLGLVFVLPKPQQDDRFLSYNQL